MLFNEPSLSSDGTHLANSHRLDRRNKALPFLADPSQKK